MGSRVDRWVLGFTRYVARKGRRDVRSIDCLTRRNLARQMFWFGRRQQPGEFGTRGRASLRLGVFALVYGSI
eukprot:1334517-Pyramimonas_sp.AAC.1